MGLLMKIPTKKWSWNSQRHLLVSLLFFKTFSVFRDFEFASSCKESCDKEEESCGGCR